MTLFARGILTRDQAQKTHELTWVVAEARQVAKLGHNAHGVNELNAAARLQRVDHWSPAPLRELLFKALREPLYALGRFLDRLHIFFKGDALRRMRQGRPRDSNLRTARLSAFRSPPMRP